MNHETYPLSSADISIDIFTGNQQIFFYQEIQV